LTNFVVVGLLYSDGCAIAALIDILMDVLHGPHGGVNLDVNMSAILPGEVRVIRDDSAII